METSTWDSIVTKMPPKELLEQKLSLAIANAESYWNRGKKNKGFQFNNEMQDRRES